MLKLAGILVFSLAAISLAGVQAQAGACLCADPSITQCTEYPVGTDESLIQRNCEKFRQKYVRTCPAPKNNFCVEGDKKLGRIFTWGADVDVDACSGTWHP